MERKIIIEVNDVHLAGKNQLNAMNRSMPRGRAYKEYRNSLYWRMCNLRNKGEPFAKARVHLHIRTLRAVDVDSKYHMGSVILDLLQPDRNVAPKNNLVLGLGWIANDTDGEGGMNGCVVEYRVTQESGHRDGGFRVIIEEVEDAGQ